MAAIAGLAGLFPNLCYLARSPGKPIPSRQPRPAPVCLEAWVRLRSYRGCPVLAAAAGYRLGIYCFPAGCSGAAGRSNGALVFAGPFPGRAYISERPVPLGAWVHLAGLEGGSSAASPSAQAVSAAVAVDGIDVTAGRLGGWTYPLALGYDPWAARMLAARAAKAARAALARDLSTPRAADCVGTPGPPDGEIGATRWSLAWRSLSQVAAGRGTPHRLPPLPPLPRQAAPPRAAASGPGGITARGWSILASGLLLALAMVGAGMALRRTPASSTREALTPVPPDER